MPGIKTNSIYQDAEVEEDAVLYRITTPSYADQQFLLNGGGSYKGEGRFHRIHQLTSYVSDNVLMCIAEKLFHMSYIALKKLRNNSYIDFRREATRKQVLVVFECKNITDLIHVESSQAINTYQLNPSTIIHPEQFYTPLQDVADQIRGLGCNGVVYPSARHSKGYSVALFGDMSSKIKGNISAKIRMTLSLVREDRSMLANDGRFDPTHNRISTNIGHFAFNATDFAQYQYLLSPNLQSAQGHIDFYRTYYGQTGYPASALK